MDTQYDFVKSLDEQVIDRMKRVVDDSVKQISRNTHNIVKLLRKIVEVCSNGGRCQPLSDILRTSKLETWLTYFENLSRKINNSFADIITHLQNMLNEDDKSKLYSVMGAEDGYSLTEILNKEVPVLKEEIAFLLGFISYPNKHLAGILEQHQRPDGGMHITSKSIANKLAVSAPSIAPTIAEAQETMQTPAKRSGDFKILSRECIDLSTFDGGQFSKGNLSFTQPKSHAWIWFLRIWFIWALSMALF